MTNRNRRPNSPSMDRRSAGAFRDLVPWADPYIVALLNKLRGAHEIAEAAAGCDAAGELPRPLGGGEHQTMPAPLGRSPRNRLRD